VREREEVERRALLLYAEQYALAARRYFFLLFCFCQTRKQEKVERHELCVDEYPLIEPY
jgi:hypothetical protein